MNSANIQCCAVSKFLSDYFYFYLSKKIPTYLYFYLSTQCDYFAQHCQYH